MCLAIPMQVKKRDEFLGVVELDGVEREISLMLEPDAQVGDWVLVHAGYAIGVVDEEEAKATVALLREAAMLVGEA